MGSGADESGSLVLFPRRFLPAGFVVSFSSRKEIVLEFELFTFFSELDLKGWILFGVLAVAVVALVILLVKMGKKQDRPASRFDTKALVYGALALSLAFVLSYLRLFRMPQGGSITPGSMLPIFVYAYWYGPKKGIIVGIAYALLQMIQDAWFVHPAQIFLDYILAFGVLGVAGFFKKNLYAGIIVGGLLRFASHLVSGVIFFAEYAPEGVSPWIYSLGYQASCILPDLVICLVLAVILKKTIDRLKPAVV